MSQTYIIVMEDAPGYKAFTKPDVFTEFGQAKTRAVELSKRYGRPFYVFARVGHTYQVPQPTWGFTQDA